MAFNFNIRNIFTQKREERSIPSTFGLPLTQGFWTSNALSNPVVIQCMGLIEDNIAKAGFKLYNVIGGKEVLIENSILDTPNQRMNQFDLIKLIVHNLLVDGSAFVYCPHNTDGSIKSLHYLPNSVVTIIPPQDYLKDELTFNISGMKEPVKQKDMLYFGNIPLAENGYEYTSPVQLCAKHLQMASLGEETAKKYWGSSAGLFGILKSNKGNLRDDQKTKMKEEWNKALSNTDGNSIIFSEADISYEAINNSSNGSNLIASRKYEALQICRIFNVDSVFIFDGSISYNSLEAKQVSFLTNTLMPYITRIQLEFERKLPPTQNIKFNDQGFLQGDLTTMSNYLKSLVATGIISPNEARERLGYDKVEGYDKLLTPVNQAQLNQKEIEPINKNNEDKQ